MFISILCISLFILKVNPCRIFFTKSTFRLISKNSILYSVFEFVHSDPQLDQDLKPTKKLKFVGTIFLYIFKYLYVYFLIYLEMQKIKGHF